MVCYGTICCFESINMDEILMGCKGDSEFLCVQEKMCCAGGVEKFPVGMITEEGFCCKCGLPCCTYGCKKPTVCCLSDGKCLCLRSAAAFPFVEGVVDGVVCAVCCLQCAPNCGCAKPPTKAGAAAPGGEVAGA